MQPSRAVNVKTEIWDESLFLSATNKKVCLVEKGTTGDELSAMNFSFKLMLWFVLVTSKIELILLFDRLSAKLNYNKITLVKNKHQRNLEIYYFTC